MKPWSRFGLRPAIGLVIDGGQIALSVVATTPRGRREIARESQECGGQSPEVVLGRMLETWVPAKGAKRAKPKPWIQLGVPESQVFQAVVPIAAANRNAAAQAYFLEAVQATNLRAEERIIEVLKLELDKQPLACVAASPRGAITGLVEMMNGLGTRVGMAEPAPAALFRAGAFSRKAPSGSKLCVRFFLGPQSAIGVLATGARPLFWHTFSLPSGEETVAILAAYSTLWMMGRHCRIMPPIDTVIIHGRPEVILTQEAGAFHQRTGARLIRCAEPDYGPAAAALGTALANPLTDDIGLDLASTLKAAPSIHDIFPWVDLVVHAALLGVVTLYLSGVAAEADVRLQTIGTGLKAFSWLKDQNQAKLDEEKKFVQDQLKAIETFRSGRANWSASLRTIAAAAPESTVITSLSGDAPVEAKSKGGGSSSKKQLVINFTTPMSEDGSLPRELDAFLATLRGEPALKRTFPLIEVTGLRANPTRAGERPSASFNIVGLPGAAPPPKSAPTKAIRKG
ncbi:MAG: hypothetical protein ACLQGP_06590 [Isosphaeraceae bacterium]